MLRMRMTEATAAKAARGELRLPLPAGLDYDDDGRVVLSRTMRRSARRSCRCMPCSPSSARPGR